MAFDISSANAYFRPASHTRSGVWVAFQKAGPDPALAAIEQAKRILTRFVKRALVEPTDPTDLTEFPREDYAVYEQALYLLENGIVADGTQATAKFIAGRTEKDEVRERPRGIIAPEALHWLFRGRIMISRG